MDDDDSIIGDIFDVGVALAIAYTTSEVQKAISGKQDIDISGYIPVKNSILPCINLTGGYARVTPSVLFQEAKDGAFWRIGALSDGKVAGYSGYYIGDDKVGLDGDGWVTSIVSGTDDGRYVRLADPAVKVLSRVGLPTETYYGPGAYTPADAFPSDIYSSDMRGDNTATMAVGFYSRKKEIMGQLFPFGGGVGFSAITRGVFYDWRYDSTVPGGSGSQRMATPSTWAACSNPVVCLINRMIYRWGYDWTTQVLPVIAALTTQANICDEPIDLDAGGTEPRYSHAGWYYDTDDEDSILQRYKAAMDGFITEDAFGRVIIKAGKLETPTVTFTDEHIIEYDWKRGIEQESAVDRFVVQFVDPNADYRQNECDPWVIGAGDREETLTFDWVTSFTQARRLAKRAAARRMPNYRGTIVLTEYGLKALDQRYVTIQNSRESSMSDVMVEVTNVTYDVDTGITTLSIQSVDENVDEWNEATEEGAAPGVINLVTPAPLTAPTIDDVDVLNTSGTVRLGVEATGPNRTDLDWEVRHKPTGQSSWKYEYTSDVYEVGLGVVELSVGPVPIVGSLDLEVRYVTPGGEYSDWSATATPDTTIPETAPDPPTLVAGTGNVGSADIDFRAPTSINYDHIEIWRNTVNNFGTATQVGGDLPVGLGVESTYNDTIAAGTYYYWVLSSSASGLKSSPVATGSVTVT